MNERELEKQLREQPIRPIPAHWREEILRAVQLQAGAESEAGAGRVESLPGRMKAPSKGKESPTWWRDLLWPHPVAWAGLAAAWVLIVGLNTMALRPSHSSGGTRSQASRPATPSDAMKMALAEQWKLREELLSWKTAAEEEGGPPPKAPPADARPRSQAQPQAFIVTQASCLKGAGPPASLVQDEVSRLVV